MRMRRDQRQTGSPRSAKPRKIDSVHPSVASGFRAGPFARDRYLQDVKKPSNRALRRSFGANLKPQTRKG